MNYLQDRSLSGVAPKLLQGPTPRGSTASTSLGGGGGEWIPQTVVDATEQNAINREEAAAAELASQPDQIFAQLIRDQYDRFEQIGRPLQNQAAANILDPERSRELRGEALNYAQKATTHAFDSAKARESTYRSRFGQQHSATDKKLMEDRSAVRKSAATVSARNAVRGALADREMELLGG